MLTLAIVLIVVPAIEMRCPIFSSCEQEDEFFPGWARLFKKAPFKTPPSTPGELEDYFKDLQAIFQNSSSTTPLKSGEYLMEGQCLYTCTETGGCSAQLAVDWANVTEYW